ncbi:MAG: amino acid permease [Pyrinomonadaceae bacterium]|nr:amino acid permease [Pyrinomonadaceae bacterium]
MTELKEKAGADTLKRDIRLIDAVGIGLGAIIGAGIFVVTGVAAGVAGPAFVIGLVIAGIAATCNALSSAELAATYPQSGGTYEYGYRLLNPWFGFAAGWMFLAGKLAAGGTVALGFGAYFSALVPAVPPVYAAVAAAVILTAANLFGIKKAGRLNTAIVSVTILTLVYFVIAGIPSFDAANLSQFMPHGFSGVAESAALLFFAYTGYARIATLGEEVHEPKKTIPRAVIITLVVSVVLYIAVALVAVGTSGSASLAASASPLQAAAQKFTIPGVFWIVGVGAATAMFGVLLSQIVGISRMMFAMARRGDLPSALEHVSRSRSVPDVGIVLSGAVIVTLAVFGTLQFVISAAAFTILIYYGIANICALKMEKADKLYPKAVAVVGLIFCIAMAASLPLVTIAAGLSLLAAGFIFRVIFRKFTGTALEPADQKNSA